MTLDFTNAAEADFQRTMLEGLERFGVRQAEAYLDGPISARETIARNPEVARLRTEYTPPVRIYRFGSHISVCVTDEEGS